MNRIERHTNGRDLNKTVSPGWLAGLVLAFGFLLMAASGASAETRTLKLYNLHTKEKAEITFKRNGRYDSRGLQQANQFLRDWRRNEPTKMDPRLLDLIWDTYRISGSRAYINVVCGYRAPATNSMLRSRSKGVAQKSQHMLGKAMDFFIPDVKLKTLREIGLKLQNGGVGYYPTSGSPFVHMDVGNVRHWPKMSRKELVAIFPNGRTLHVPSDGKPLPGYDQAMAAYQERKKNGGSAVALASMARSGKSGGGFLSAFFGGGADDEEDSGEIAMASASPRSTSVSASAPKPTASVAKATARPSEQDEEPAAAPKSKPNPIAIVPPEDAQRIDVAALPAEQAPDNSPETIIAALPARSVPLPALAPRPKVDVMPAVAEVALPATAPVIADAGPAVPEDIPFGTNQDPLAVGTAGPAAAEPQVALNIPLPTRRPDYSPPPELASSTPIPAMVDSGPSAQDAVILAMAATGEDAQTQADAYAPLPGSRPADNESDLVVSALPEARPAIEEPQARPVDSAAVQAELKASTARVEALENAATPRFAVVERPDGSDPVAAIGSGVKTTKKASRASVQDSRPDPKPVVVAAQPQAARWVLRNDYVTTTAARGTTAPSFAYNIVRTAPREVYVAGFQQGDPVADANRFSGKAVKFLQVARFQTD